MELCPELSLHFTGHPEILLAAPLYVQNIYYMTRMLDGGLGHAYLPNDWQGDVCFGYLSVVFAAPGCRSKEWEDLMVSRTIYETLSNPYILDLPYPLFKFPALTACEIENS